MYTEEKKVFNEKMINYVYKKKVDERQILAN